MMVTEEGLIEKNVELNGFIFELKGKKRKVEVKADFVCVWRLRISDALGRYAVCQKNGDDGRTILQNHTYTHT
jgi:hypothetical protein